LKEDAKDKTKDLETIGEAPIIVSITETASKIKTVEVKLQNSANTARRRITTKSTATSASTRVIHS
jgi:hypothetical protein